MMLHKRGVCSRITGDVLDHFHSNKEKTRASGKPQHHTHTEHKAFQRPFVSLLNLTIVPRRQSTDKKEKEAEEQGTFVNKNFQSISGLTMSHGQTWVLHFPSNVHHRRIKLGTLTCCCRAAGEV
ncbi:hypothetical protein EYF80_010632 [Liparis tanakae]|uniref:Uncharacterized protein n=1 Tax=Liparis tanakae TaxID=230148 RepID=A0A4Z2IP01_9TELE|nr:hypothetical protein EYF80_010632 [Liparis tanakae]